MLAWVNLSHLMQARNRARERDFAVSLALGAGRWRVVRQMTIEAALLTLLGSAAGLLIGSLLFSWGMAQTPEYSHIYRLIPSGLDGRVVAFTIGLAVLGMMAIGIWPAWRASGRDVRASLVSAPDRRRGWRIGGEALAIAGQSAFAVGLVVTCLLVVRSFVGLVTAERGFDPARVQLAGVEVPRDEPRARTQLYRRLIEELGRVPGVEAAATANGIPALTLPEAPMDESGKPIANVIVYQASGKLAAAMDMRLEEGRLFDDNESFATAPVAVVDRSAADLMWPGQPALGRIIRLRGGRACEVVGVIARVRPLTGDSIRGTVLTSIDGASPAVSNRLTVALRFDDRQSPAAADLAAAARRADPRIVWRGTAGMSSWERTIGQPRFLASALGILAALTALMAGFGVLGVVSHVVSRRTREIGIRMALGADRAGVRLLIVRQALTPAAIGVTMGLVLAFWWSSSVRSVLIGIGPHDPWSFVVAAIATLLTVAAASVRPAMQASGIDPSHALRME
jgi:predicted permease